MPMNAPERSEILPERNHVQEHRGSPSAQPTLHELCSDEPAPPRGPVGPDAPDEGAVETFVGGAGI
jgi:hypothetical protein